jgi:hypothetical protein
MSVPRLLNACWERLEPPFLPAGELTFFRERRSLRSPKKANWPIPKSGRANRVEQE